MPNIPEPQRTSNTSGLLAVGRGGTETPRSGSVPAADGSSITWSTAADGTITASGAAGRQTLVQQVQGADGLITTVVTFSANGQGTYFTIKQSISESNRVVSTQITSNRSDGTITIALRGISNGTVVASGLFGTNHLLWSGSIDLSGNPIAILWSGLAGAGFDSNTFRSQAVEASYFDPFYKELTKILSHPTSNISLRDGHPFLWFLARAGAVGAIGFVGGAGLAVAGTVEGVTWLTGGLWGFFIASGGTMAYDDVQMLQNQLNESSAQQDAGPEGDGGADDGGADDGGGGGGGGGGDGGRPKEEYILNLTPVIRPVIRLGQIVSRTLTRR